MGVVWGPPRIAAVVGTLGWVVAGPHLRLDRGMARDGEAMREHWLRWQVDEQELHATFRTREHADLVVSTDG